MGYHSQKTKTSPEQVILPIPVQPQEFRKEGAQR
jgi:hypothetical protein